MKNVRSEVLRQLHFKTGAGAHTKSKKAARRKEKVLLKKELY
jgi:hypothetical protein